MKIKLDPGAYMPERAHETDAGLDIRSKECGVVYANSSEVFHTGVHVQLPPNTCGMMVSKSGLMVNHNITSTGLIDEPYRGEIMVKLFNHGDQNYEVCVGDKIGQLVVVPCMYVECEQVEELDESDRGINGFGSTGVN